MMVSVNTEKRRSSNWYVVLFTQCTGQVLVNKWWWGSVSTWATFCGTLQESTHEPRQTHSTLAWFLTSLRCKWDPRSFKMLRSLNLQLVTDVSEQHIGPIFKIQAVKEEGRPQTYDLLVLNGWKKPVSNTFVDNYEQVESRCWHLYEFQLQWNLY
jgi:hypothetical protein